MFVAFILLAAVLPAQLLAAPQPFAIPAGSCGVNKYATLFKYSPKTPFIVGGSETKENEFPWQVSLQQSGYHTCGGTIIGDQWILTAAHCVTGSMANPSVWKVYAGRHNIKLAEASSNQLAYLSQIIRHPSYSTLKNTNDIALMKTTTKFTFNDYVQPACLPAATTGALVGVDSIATGWGALKENGVAATTLQKVTLPVISNADCQKAYPTESIVAGNICAGFKAGGKDACQGDSGGPLHTADASGKISVNGVTSWGYGCARANYPGVYTRVSSYIDWINQSMK